MDKLEYGPFTVEVEMSNLVIKRGDDEKIAFIPGEAEAAAKLVGMARQMKIMKALPAKISSSPWEVRFFSDGTLEWARQGFMQGIKLSFNEADDLVDSLNGAITKFADVSRIQGGPRAGVRSFNLPEAPIDGK